MSVFAHACEMCGNPARGESRAPVFADDSGVIAAIRTITHRIGGAEQTTVMAGVPAATCITPQPGGEYVHLWEM